MKIKFQDLEAFLEYYYKQQSQGTLPSDDVAVSMDEKGFYFILSFLDSGANLCKIQIHEATTKMKPKLVKEMTLNSRIGKKEN